jgi:hypothetical protein
MALDIVHRFRLRRRAEAFEKGHILEVVASRKWPWIVIGATCLIAISIGFLSRPVDQLEGYENWLEASGLTGWPKPSSNPAGQHIRRCPP